VESAQFHTNDGSPGFQSRFLRHTRRCGPAAAAWLACLHDWPVFTWRYSRRCRHCDCGTRVWVGSSFVDQRSDANRRSATVAVVALACCGDMGGWRPDHQARVSVGEPPRPS